eukprot:Skav227829  [mRNA]  locus=scaffold948:365940:367429:+ [translate_table: standard]
MRRDSFPAEKMSPLPTFSHPMDAGEVRGDAEAQKPPHAPMPVHRKCGIQQLPSSQEPLPATTMHRTGNL